MGTKGATPRGSGVAGVQVEAEGLRDPQGPRIPLTPGAYAARVYSRGLHTISEDGLDGEDRYHVVLWPTDEDHPAQVLKRYPEPLPGG
ncbi:MULTISPECIES: hypothetical protein [Streptomyces]|uniref:hypothetical protein n=1 Tax=Streptomyces TaxID=1883 RepID=UPI003435ED3A